MHSGTATLISLPRGALLLSRAQASVSELALRTLGEDEGQEPRVGLLLLGEGAVLAHRFDRPLAAEMDDDQQSDAGLGAIATSDW